MINKDIQLNNTKLENTILYADDQILMATSEDELQTMAHHLNLITRKYKMTISSTKTKSMAMWGNHIQRLKIAINDNTGCPTRYRTRNFFNNFTTNEDIATKFEAGLPQCVRNMTTS